MNLTKMCYIHQNYLEEEHLRSTGSSTYILALESYFAILVANPSYVAIQSVWTQSTDSREWPFCQFLRARFHNSAIYKSTFDKMGHFKVSLSITTK